MRQSTLFDKYKLSLRLLLEFGMESIEEVLSDDTYLFKLNSHLFIYKKISVVISFSENHIAQRLLYTWWIKEARDFIEISLDEVIGLVDEEFAKNLIFNMDVFTNDKQR